MTIRTKIENKVNIQRNKKTIVVNKEGDLGSYYDRQIITQRKASKTLSCLKCGKEIKKGDIYVRNKIIFSGDYHVNQFRVDFICKNCWKGELPPLIANNRLSDNNISEWDIT